MLFVPLDHDLVETIARDPITLALAGIYGLASAFGDVRAIAAGSLKRMKSGDSPTVT
jgi:hypothetical protein